MIAEERKVLSPLARKLRVENANLWSALKYETQFGPNFGQFPYHPSAVEFQVIADAEIAALGDATKQALVAAWHSKPRYPFNFKDDERILKQYAMILVELIVTRACQAGARTIDFGT